MTFAEAKDYQDLPIAIVKAYVESELNTLADAL